MIFFGFFFFKQKTAYDMRISDWSSDVCSSDLGSGRVVDVETGGCGRPGVRRPGVEQPLDHVEEALALQPANLGGEVGLRGRHQLLPQRREIPGGLLHAEAQDRKSTRLNSSH